MKTINLDDQDIDPYLNKVISFVQQEKLIEAIQLLNETTSLGLKGSKDIVEQLRNGKDFKDIEQPMHTFQSEKVQTSDIMGKLTVTYFDTEGKKHNIMPTDRELWARAKELAGPNNNVIKKYEEIYQDIQNKITPDTNESELVLGSQYTSGRFTTQKMWKFALFIIIVCIIFIIINYYNLW